MNMLINNLYILNDEIGELVTVAKQNLVLSHSLTVPWAETRVPDLLKYELSLIGLTTVLCLIILVLLMR